MKKLLSVFCMAILAGGMIFTSCTKNFTITVNSNNDAWGTAMGTGTYVEGAVATLTATPAAGYAFEKWQDGNTENPRTITVSANETYTAYFKLAEPSVKVSFKGTNWTAGDYAGQYYEGESESGPYSGWVVVAVQTPNSEFPECDVAMLSGKNTGSFTANAGTNGGLDSDNFNYIEYYENTGLSDGTYDYGDWWAKTATVNVTSFDATALTISSNVTATMFSASEAFVQSEGAVGVDAASTAPMTENITNVTLTTSKGMVKKHGAKKLVAVK